jgi:putative phage-type endonuclease
MHKIKYYQHKFSVYNQNTQGSHEWYQSRKFSFGGSELSSVLGKNKNKSFEEVMNEKHEISESKMADLGTDATCWGKLFEPVSKHFIRLKYGSIFEFGSIPHPFYPVSFSPDGLLLNPSKTDILLLEIKNPICRGILLQNGKTNIPEYYIPQIQSGLNIFNCEYCVFAQFRFRRCKLTENSQNMQFDRVYHKEYVKRCGFKYPMAFGYLYWKADTKSLIDLAQFENMLLELTKWISNPQELFNPAFIINEEPNLSTYSNGFILKWKLFETQYERIDPDRNFLVKHEGILWNKFKEMMDFTS